MFAVCPIGSYLNAGNGGACEVCPENTYSTEINSNSCTNCPAGTNGQQNTCGKNILSALIHPTRGSAKPDLFEEIRKFWFGFYNTGQGEIIYIEACILNQ